MSDANWDRDRWSAEHHRIGICGRRLVIESYDEPTRYKPMYRVEGFEFSTVDDPPRAINGGIPLPEPIDFDSFAEAKAWAKTGSDNA